MTELNIKDKLQKLHIEIAQCRKCEQSGLDVLPANQMFRGIGGDVMCAGIEPGNTELTSGEAFTGAAGKRLIKWLQQAGLGSDREEIFKRAYFTSLLKCKRKNENDLNKCYINCQNFMRQQIDIIRPRIFLTLGIEPLRYLFGFTENLTSYVGNSYTEAELRGHNENTFFLLSPNILLPDAKIIPLPHPSPGSRWLNESQNQKKLEAALTVMRELL